MDRTIIVTGASRGLGEAVALRAAELGLNVVLNARSVSDLERVALSIRNSGGTARLAPGDIGRAEVCHSAVQEALTAYGRLDAVINNAGTVEPMAQIVNTDPVLLERSLAVNLLGPMMLTTVALPHLRPVRGRVINVSSGAAETPITGSAAYCAAKAGLNQFNRVLAVEEPQVTSIAVRPGVVDTAMQEAIRQGGAGAMSGKDYARFLGYFEKGRLQPPEVPAKAVVALALHAPNSWSGDFLNWDDEPVQALIDR